MDDPPDVSFLHRVRVGTGRLILNGPRGSRHVFEHLNTSIIERNCPLLALSFEPSAKGSATANLDVPSIAAGICLLRYIYTENYGWPGSECDTSMLLTAHITLLADFLNYSDLYLAANATLLAKIDFAASFPSAPHDLYDTIRFLWAHNCPENIKESLLNYCVAAFTQHSLGSQPEFLKLSEEHIDFHMGLSRVNCERGYDEPAILHLPGPNHKPRYPLEDDQFAACVFSDDSDSIIWEDEEDDTEEEQPAHQTRPLFLELPVRTKQNQQTEPEIVSVPTSPASSDGFVVVEDPFQSPFDSGSESGWEVIE